MASWGGGMNWELGINIYIDTTIYKIDNQQGPTQAHICISIPLQILFPFMFLQNF